MKAFIAICAIVFVVCLIAERCLAVGHRRALKHLVHVNGTRGKSAVTRLIAAGLQGGGMRVYCKTTGTLPMTIDPEGNETEIHRRGGANIGEQLRILAQAAKSGADVLVIECMAVDPELQFVSEHRMLNSDVGVITNVRIDHMAEMGTELPEVCRALCNTVPDNGTVFTADTRCFGQITQEARRRGSKAVLADACDVELPEEPFPENVALALAVCAHLGVERNRALEGMRNVKPDPYAASRHTLPGGAVFINALSANDPESTARVYSRFTSDLTGIVRRVFILNCRPDRGYRTGLMLDWLVSERPDEVRLTGEGSSAALRRLRRISDIPVRSCPGIKELELENDPAGTLLFAFGNIAGPGIDIMKYVREEDGKDVC